jgi:spore maturation protein CgeB
MHVGVIGSALPDRLADNIGDALRRMGLDVVQLGPVRAQWGRRATAAAVLARQALPSLDQRIQDRISRAALDAGCEIVINVDAELSPSVVTELARAGVRVAFWFPDCVSNMGRQLMLLAPYDALFFTDAHIVERLRANLELPVYYLPEACNPRWHRPLVPAGTDPYLVIAGNMYPSRVRLLERLAAKGIPLRLYGGGFPRRVGETAVRSAHVGRAVVREEKAQVFRAAAGVLNNLHPAVVAGPNARLFEATGSGAAVLTEYRPAISDLFEAGTEVLVYRDFGELLAHATSLLNEPGLTARLGDAAARRAHRDHTFDLRVTEILEKIS